MMKNNDNYTPSGFLIIGDLIVIIISSLRDLNCEAKLSLQFRFTEESLVLEQTTQSTNPSGFDWTGYHYSSYPSTMLIASMRQ